MIVSMTDKDGVTQTRHINPKNYNEDKHKLIKTKKKEHIISVTALCPGCQCHKRYCICDLKEMR